MRFCLLPIELRKEISQGVLIYNWVERFLLFITEALKMEIEAFFPALMTEEHLPLGVLLSRYISTTNFCRLILAVMY